MRIPSHCAIVSGGASGLGAAVVNALIERGARVASLDLQPTAHATVSLSADVADAASVKAAVDDAHAALGGIHFIFNCAGIGAMAPVVQEGAPDSDAMSRLLKVNLIGTWNVIRFAIAYLQHNTPNESGERGVIVNTASISAMDGPPGFAPYSASKAGVVAMTAPLALEFGTLGIRVCTIAPGMFETPMLNGLPDLVRAEMVRHMIFPRRAGNPARFADLALHIVENDYLNATTIRIDAGARAPIPS